MKITLDLDGAIAAIKQAVDVQLTGARNALVLIDGNSDIALLDGDAKNRALDKIARSVLQVLADYGADEDVETEIAAVHA